jgi:hypothetical protein
MLTLGTRQVIKKAYERTDLKNYNRANAKISIISKDMPTVSGGRIDGQQFKEYQSSFINIVKVGNGRLVTALCPMQSGSNILLLYSDDNGETWQQSAMSEPYTRPSNTPRGVRILYSSSIAGDPTKSIIIFTGGFYSIDNGLTYSRCSNSSVYWSGTASEDTYLALVGDTYLANSSGNKIYFYKLIDIYNNETPLTRKTLTVKSSITKAAWFGFEVIMLPGNIIRILMTPGSMSSSSTATYEVYYADILPDSNFYTNAWTTSFNPTWNKANGTITDAKHLALCTATNGRLFCGTNTGAHILYSDDNGVNWSECYVYTSDSTLSNYSGMMIDFILEPVPGLLIARRKIKSSYTYMYSIDNGIHWYDITYDTYNDGYWPILLNNGKLRIFLAQSASDVPIKYIDDIVFDLNKTDYLDANGLAEIDYQLKRYIKENTTY